MVQVAYTPEQEVAFWRTVIRHATNHVKRKYHRWAREELILNSVTEGGDEVSDLIPAGFAEQAFKDVDLRLTIDKLPSKERYVIQGIYVKCHTQREIAAEMLVSQSKVNQLHQKALNRLRGIITNEM